MRAPAFCGRPTINGLTLVVCSAMIDPTTRNICWFSKREPRLLTNEREIIAARCRHRKEIEIDCVKQPSVKEKFGAICDLRRIGAPHLVTRERDIVKDPAFADPACWTNTHGVLDLKRQCSALFCVLAGEIRDNSASVLARSVVMPRAVCYKAVVSRDYTLISRITIVSHHRTEKKVVKLGEKAAPDRRTAAKDPH